MQRQVVRFPTYNCSLVLNASYLSCLTMNGCRKSQEQALKRQPYSNGGAAQATQRHPLDLRVQVLCPHSFLYILINVFLAEQKIRVIRCNSVFAYPKSDFFFFKHPIILKTQEFVNFNNRATQTTYMNKVKAGNKYLLMLD